MAFNITSLLNDESLKERFERKKIHYTKLIPNEKNIYSLSNIDELADDIQDNGLLQNLVVKATKDGKYRIVVGHRRYQAIKKIVEERGDDSFENIDCYVISLKEDELLTELKLHTSNTNTRELSEYEKLQAITELKRIYQELRSQGIQMKGKTREIISEQVGLKPTQVQKYLSLSENGDQETLQKLKQGDITLEDAYYKTMKPERKDSISDQSPDRNLETMTRIRQLKKAGAAVAECRKWMEQENEKKGIEKNNWELLKREVENIGKELEKMEAIWN